MTEMLSAPPRETWETAPIGLAAARALDRTADLLLADGRTVQAERLANLAAEMRGAQ